MTVTYKTRGELTHPINDLDSARLYLREACASPSGMSDFVWQDRRDGVHSVTWDLIDASHWEVVLVADHPLPPQQLALLSEWISGQNSDGLGEGFEQQPFAEHDEVCGDGTGEDEHGEYHYAMSSFDWQTNECILEEVR